MGCCNDHVGGGKGGHLDMFGEPFDSVSNAGGSGGGDPNGEAAVGFHGGADVPSGDSMWCPAGPVVGVFKG